MARLILKGKTMGTFEHGETHTKTINAHLKALEARKEELSAIEVMLIMKSITDLKKIRDNLYGILDRFLD